MHLKRKVYRMSTKRYADTALAKYLDRRVLELKPKRQADIAEEAGFASHNMMSMLRSGANKVPLDRVPALADALNCDRAFLLRLALEQEVGNTAATAIMDIMGVAVTQNEQQWLAEIRDASNGSDPRLTSRLRAALRAIF